jgi:hypothetical protein
MYYQIKAKVNTEYTFKINAPDQKQAIDILKSGSHKIKVRGKDLEFKEMILK